MSQDNSRNIVTPVLVVLLVSSAFAVGYLWNKVHILQNNTGETAGTETTGQLAVSPTPVVPTNIPVPDITADDHIRGNPNATVALVEYSDYDCPYCSNFHKTIKQVLEEYGDQVMWVYRHFPLSSIHPDAQDKSEASECVASLGGEDAFWEFSDAMYEQSRSLDELPELVESLGVNATAFQECLDSNTYENKVNTHFTTGISAGVSGTPGNFLLNVETGDSVPMNGAVPFSYLQPELDAMLE